MAIKREDGFERELERLAQLSGSETTEDRLLVYGTDKGIKIDIRYAGETLWMTQAQIGQLFGKTVSTISRHITNVFEEGELVEEGNLQKTQIAGATKPVALYSLDVIISVGYRVNSKQATQFRIWATERLKEILLKGWSIDVARMKNPESRDHLKELKETIRDIRSSEANLYREVRSICAMCQDYDPQSEEWRNFYAGMQNKLLWAVASKTGPELILERANADAENMGLTTWANENIRKNDVWIANNFLAGAEIREKNRLTTMLLDYFEDQVDIGRLVMMAEAEERMNGFIKFNNRPLLTHLGSVKREKAQAHAERQFEKFKEKRRTLRQGG
ncbi:MULTISPECIES: RhuM family protein [unclassified Mesorhizobium]|uniref:RhuM family protein n=1 Tax=unclassified Mesorhizobium TaxID=325217 RepID=UPI0003CED385|nr:MULTISPECIES: RhuM family protein [unclassified Mesorhizobium]ESX21678.1 toxin Fic [Mesorhizobium sp. LSJC255A00]ESX28536.1 toxin Fic [Mesorhizobium sp. LSHC440B00]ESX37296.1 toxin Fic [Mesorhizobium sp. LSHC432A00]ESX42368.1 toxin Fic [Mesorhizobium sp. LSHC440A00]ESX77127.1 toxin Fic [Mesorhizobium sp. LSHC414A00]